MYFQNLKKKILSYLVEICVDSLESASNAQEAGAARVELCTALSVGGLTPSLGLLTAVRSNTDIQVNVIIRPRGGDFLYSDSEFSIMRRDVEIAGEAGADGIVTGILLSDGSIDIDRTALLAEYASPMSLTFHRAFDMCRDPDKGLDDIIFTGAKRILTSGQARKAVEGVPLIRRLVNAAGDRIVIMPGSGIDEYNIAVLANSTGAREFHLSGRHSTDSKMTYRRKSISMGGNQPESEYTLKIADIERIRSVIKILRGIEI